MVTLKTYLRLNLEDSQSFQLFLPPLCPSGLTGFWALKKAS